MVLIQVRSGDYAVTLGKGPPEAETGDTKMVDRRGGQPKPRHRQAQETCVVE